MPFTSRNPLACRADETPQEWAKRIRAERGPMPEEMQNRIQGILRTSPLHPEHVPAVERA